MSAVAAGERRPRTWFRFGRNWAEFERRALDQASLERAERALAALIGPGRLHGRTFLDIGCGSGIHAVAAARLGARSVVAMDVDPDSVAVARRVVERFRGAADRVRVVEGSVLDPRAMAAAGPADVVYSWGALHHTGSMYRAIAAAAAAVAPGGELVIAIYNRHFTSPAWTVVKWLYNRLPGPGRRAAELSSYPVLFLGVLLATGKSPLAKERGMDFGCDVADWIGGYPYEYAGAAEVSRFVEGLGFATVKVVPPRVGTGCNEFVFRRHDAG